MHLSKETMKLRTFLEKIHKPGIPGYLHARVIKASGVEFAGGKPLAQFRLKGDLADLSFSYPYEDSPKFWGLVTETYKEMLDENGVPHD